MTPVCHAPRSTVETQLMVAAVQVLVQGMLAQLWAPLISVGGLYRRLRNVRRPVTSASTPALSTWPLAADASSLGVTDCLCHASLPCWRFCHCTHADLRCAISCRFWSAVARGSRGLYPRAEAAAERQGGPPGQAARLAAAGSGASPARQRHRQWLRASRVAGSTCRQWSSSHACQPQPAAGLAGGCGTRRLQQPHGGRPAQPLQQQAVGSRK